jgi:hypothetical protein
MKKLLLTSICLVMAVFANGQAPTFQWAKQMISTTGGVGLSISVDASGNVYTTGYFIDTVDFDPGPGTFNLISNGGSDIFISKLDASGNFVWAKSMGGSLDDVANSIALDTLDNIYITGYFQGTADFNPGAGVFNLTAVGDSDIFVSKLDASGNLIWAKNMGGPLGEVANSIAVDHFGSVYTTGYFSGTVDFDPNAGTFNLSSTGSNDIFISKLDSLGNFVWAKSIGGTLNEQGSSIALDNADNVYTTGYFNGTVDFDPGAGIVNLTSGVNENMFISKLDALGNFVWAKNIGGTGSLDFVSGNAIKIDASDNVYTTGVFNGKIDFDPSTGIFDLITDTTSVNQSLFVSKLDAFGNFVWAKSMYSPGGGAFGNSIALDISGNAYASGTFYGTVDFDPGVDTFNLTFGAWGIDNSAFISKLDASGNFVWAVNIVGYSYGQSVAVDALDNVYTTGAFIGTTDFDPGMGTYNLSTPAYVANIFVHKMIQTPTGINEYTNNNNIRIYPNPATNQLTIETTKATNVSIINLLGQELLNTKIERSETIDVSFLADGIYFVKDLNNGGSIKFIKQ